MDTLLNIDWSAMFVPKISLIEIAIRGTVMYFGLFIILRIFRRQSGSVGVADLLVLVLIADAAQNGMAGDSKSVSEALLLISTIVLWDWAFDWLGFSSKMFRRIVSPEPLVLIKNGRVIRKNLDSEMITDDELMAQLRLQGIENIADVEKCCLESNGHFSIIEKPDKAKKAKDNENNTTTVH